MGFFIIVIQFINYKTTELWRKDEAENGLSYKLSQFIVYFF